MKKSLSNNAVPTFCNLMTEIKKTGKRNIFDKSIAWIRFLGGGAVVGGPLGPVGGDAILE
ncbi:MAG TPA: hypothetical protein ENK91_04515 [Bacteroidetes bacterium]|nr:hypothetical protein [Bacteroidota bacterium]